MEVLCLLFCWVTHRRRHTRRRSMFCLFLQGKPVGTPDPSSYYRILQQHDVCAMFTAPTAMRALRREVTVCDFCEFNQSVNVCLLATEFCAWHYLVRSQQLRLLRPQKPIRVDVNCDDPWPVRPVRHLYNELIRQHSSNRCVIVFEWLKDSLFYSVYRLLLLLMKLIIPR